MSTSMILVVGGLTSIGVYLVTSRVLSRIVLGFALLGHAVVIALLTAGGPAGEPPLADDLAADGDLAEVANPLPQALSLTAIVISFGLTLFVLALARRQRELSGDDLVEDDLEDRRVAASEYVVDEAETDVFGSDRADSDGDLSEPGVPDSAASESGETAGDADEGDAGGGDGRAARTAGSDAGPDASMRSTEEDAP